MSFSDLCQQYFGTRNLFDVFQISEDATDKEVRKAYHKLSLLYHPDRVEENKKAEATEKFKILGKIHSILTNSEKRAFLAETGFYFQGDDEDLGTEDWLVYWQFVFKKITVDDIKKYEEQYKGSDEELSDIKRAYNQWKGDMDRMYESIPFLSLSEESRVRARIQKLIDSKELEPYNIFINEPQTKRDRRIRKMKKEEKLAEKEMKKEMEEKEEGEMDGLAKAILQRRQASSESFVTALEKKYVSTSGKKTSRKNKKP